jgi:hypothetical protein
MTNNQETITKQIPNIKIQETKRHPLTFYLNLFRLPLPQRGEESGREGRSGVVGDR